MLYHWLLAQRIFNRPTMKFKLHPVQCTLSGNHFQKLCLKAIKGDESKNQWPSSSSGSFHTILKFCGCWTGRHKHTVFLSLVAVVCLRKTLKYFDS